MGQTIRPATLQSPGTAERQHKSASERAMEAGRAAMRSTPAQKSVTSKPSAVRPVSTLQKVRSLFGGRR